MKPAFAWAIAMPGREDELSILPYSIKRTRSDAIKDFTFESTLTWARCRKVGYQCIRVKVVPA